MRPTNSQLPTPNSQNGRLWTNVLTGLAIWEWRWALTGDWALTLTETPFFMTTVPSSFFKHRGVRVETAGLSKQYRMGPEEVHALRETDLQIEKGSAVAIMGPSGCGKTTLLNLLGGVDRPSGGLIGIDGDDTVMNERMLEKHRLLHVGFVFQFFNLIPSITAIENLELPMVMAGVPDQQCHDRARTLLGMVGLESKGQKRPQGVVGRRAAARGHRAGAATTPRSSSPTSRPGIWYGQRRDHHEAASRTGLGLRQDRHHGEPRSQGRRALPHGVFDAGWTVRAGGVTGGSSAKQRPRRFGVLRRWLPLASRDSGCRCGSSEAARLAGYRTGSMPWALITAIARRPVRNLISCRAASGSFACDPTPAAKVT